MWGYSGGAISTGWAGALLSTYAPELNVVGAAHGGTPASLQPCVEIIVRISTSSKGRKSASLTWSAERRRWLRPQVMLLNGHPPPLTQPSTVLISAATGLATAYPGINESLYSLATPKMLALIEDTKATKCSGNSDANNVDFFSTTEYFTSGNKTLGLSAWQVRENLGTPLKLKLMKWSIGNVQRDDAREDEGAKDPAAYLPRQG